MPEGLAGRTWEIIRYVANGLAASAVQFGTLSFLIEVLHVPSAAFASLLASALGIAASYLGNRYFVFPGRSSRIGTQIAKFVLLYAFLATVQAALLLVWSDLLHWNYQLGFLIGLGLQFAGSYFGNRKVVFRK